MARNPRSVSSPFRVGMIGCGVGIADMADAAQKRRQHRMNGELALHIVEVMEAFHVSARTGLKQVSSCTT